MVDCEWRHLEIRLASASELANVINIISICCADLNAKIIHHSATKKSFLIWDLEKKKLIETSFKLLPDSLSIHLAHIACAIADFGSNYT